jgi:hypothetical protein
MALKVHASIACWDFLQEFHDIPASAVLSAKTKGQALLFLRHTIITRELEFSARCEAHTLVSSGGFHQA